MANPSENSINWFKKTILSFATNAIALQNSGVGRILGVPKLGRLVLYWYDPKLKAELPYYDRFPLVLPLNYYADGFLGLNFHYLPPGARLAFFEQLQAFASNQKMFDSFKKTYNAGSKLKVVYPYLRDIPQLSDYAPCIKRYLFSHVRSPFLDLDPKYWENVIMLPVQRFVKGKPW
jgi:hypothetical protein